MSEIRVDKIISHAGNSAPDFPQGANVTGVLTATSLSATNLSGSGANITSIPAGQLTGTVADARLSTVSSSKLSGALPALDASNLTGVKAEPTIDIVASGSIGSGKAVVIRTDGKAGIVTGVTESFGDLQKFAETGDGNSSQDIAWDPINNRVVVAYRDADDSGKGKARVGTVTGQTISWGTAVDFNGGDTRHIHVLYHTNTQKIILSYQDAGNSSYPTAKIGTVSGTTISFASGQTAASAGSNFNAIVDVVGTDKFVQFWYDTSGTGKCAVGTISGTSISFGSVVQFSSAIVQSIGATFDTLNNVVIVFFAKAISGYKAVTVGGIVSGTSISFGSEVQIGEYGDTIDYGYDYQVNYDTNTNRIIWAWSNASQSGTSASQMGTRNQYVQLGVVVPRTGSNATPMILYSAPQKTTESGYIQQAAMMKAVWSTAKKELYMTYRNHEQMSNYFQKASIITGTNLDAYGPSSTGVGATWFADNNQMAFSPRVGFANTSPVGGNYGGFDLAIDDSAKKVFISLLYRYNEWSDAASAKSGSVVVYNMQDTNLTTGNLLGFSKSSYTDGQTATIKLNGAIDINQVGLTSATTQYLKPDASLTNDPIADGLFYDNAQRKYVPVSAGIALSATNLIIKT